jgi:hypothetical protein
MLLGVVHHLQNDAALARQTNATLTKNLDEIAGSFWTVDALAVEARCAGVADILKFPFPALVFLPAR